PGVVTPDLAHHEEHPSVKVLERRLRKQSLLGEPRDRATLLGLVRVLGTFLPWLVLAPDRPLQRRQQLAPVRRAHEHAGRDAAFAAGGVAVVAHSVSTHFSASIWTNNLSRNSCRRTGSVSVRTSSPSCSFHMA